MKNVAKILQLLSIYWSQRCEQITAKSLQKDDSHSLLYKVLKKMTYSEQATQRKVTIFT